MQEAVMEMSHTGKTIAVTCLIPFISSTKIRTKLKLRGDHPDQKEPKIG